MTGPAGTHLHPLRQSADIERVKRLGRRYETSLFTVLVYPSGLAGVRVGIVVGRRFGSAVVRNRAKRIFREVARHAAEIMRPGYDLVVFPRRKALAVRHDDLRSTWNELLNRHGILVPRAS